MSATPDRESRFRTWLEEYGGIVGKVARSFTQTHADEVELQQELLLQLWISAKAYAEQAKPSTWVYRVCLNTALTWRRGNVRREQHIDPAVDVTAVATPAASPAESTGDRELLDQLYAAIHGLPSMDRALVLLMLDGLAYREIGDITGLTENHVGVALTRARQRLATELKGVADELE